MNETIKNLEEALALSPDNVPLRLHLAELMLQEKMYAEAAVHFGEVLQKSYGNVKAQTGLANCYYNTGKFSAAIIIYEQLQHQLPAEDTLRFVKCLIKENSLQEAAAHYQKIIAANPSFRDEEIDGYLRMPSNGGGALEDDLFGDDDSLFFMEKPNIKFEDVGGMQRIKNEISLKIIQPLKNPELYKAFGKKPVAVYCYTAPPAAAKPILPKLQQVRLTPNLSISVCTIYWICGLATARKTFTRFLNWPGKIRPVYCFLMKWMPWVPAAVI